MHNGNGGIIGARRVPTAQAAGGVWGVQDAYTADRDAQWPRWPQNIGIPFDARLRMWLEADYGLYQDVDATVPVISDAQPVRSWINRGNAGRLINNRQYAPTFAAATRGYKAVFFAKSVAKHFDELICDRRAYNYAFAVHSTFGTASAARQILHAPESGTGSTVRSFPTIVAGIGSGNGLLVGKSMTSTLAVQNYGNAGIYLSSQLGGLVTQAAGDPLQVVGTHGASTVMSTVSSLPLPGPAAVSVGGVEGETSIANLPNDAALHAVIWYSCDEPMTAAECQQVLDYLATKYGVAKPVLA
ncbi:hypothetical protein U5903_04225 [Cereibacter johrii]|uniref:hypothetical protein n=1 Tax=Cereibacter johrii TaxID=445629 RepID=UPI002B256731|nr:hypothetical protein [Cereibacter johrii]MEA5159975.1 hypothetical protein [Cereibacter johrii]